MLRLSEEDQREYERQCQINNIAKQLAIATGDAKAARAARQANTRLYQAYELKQLPPPPPTKYDIENSLSVEARLDRIEQHLKIGRYADDY